MPEIVEVKIMSEFINKNSKGRIFNKLFHVEKGNNAIDSKLIEKFNIESDSNGKELYLRVYNSDLDLKFSVFMGMSGNWKLVPTSEWNSTKFTRMRLDSEDGQSLLLYGGYMGPKYKLGGFTGIKRGPDPMKEFDKFKSNILQNIDNKSFNKPICEVLLDQKYFNGIGNYLRSTILYYADVNPFQIARESIKSNLNIIDLCSSIPIKSYELNGGQLRDWKNPFDNDSKDFENWVFYKKGKSATDGTGRTFWYHDKWESICPY